MKQRVLIILSLAACAGHYAHAQVRTQLLSQHVLLATGGTWDSNLVAISSGAGLVVVDTYDTPVATAEALEKARERFPEERILFLVNTHGHDDHVWGNELFGDVPIIAHRHTHRYMAERREELIPFFSGQRIRDLESRIEEEDGQAEEERKGLGERLASARTAYEKWGSVKITLPTVTLELGADLHAGERTIEIRYLGWAHTKGDLVVFLPDEGILMVGDLVGRPTTLLTLDGVQGDVVGWLSALRELHSRYGQRTSKVVTGHGEAGGVERLETAIEYLSYLLAEVTAAQKRGWSLQEAKERLELERLRSFESFDELRENNIEATWQSLRRQQGSEGLNLAGSPPAHISGSIDRRVAVTFDDLPGTALTPEQRCSSESLLAVSKRILAPFRREGWPVAGFVTESRLCEQLSDVDLTRVLRFWIDSGAELGNHTFGHVDLNDESAESFIADIERGERVLRGLLEEAGQRPRYFRYPYLHAGNTREKWTRVRAWLASKNYILGVVTMDNQEWVYSSVYARAKARDDRAVMAEVMAGYLAHLSESVEYFERLSQQRFGRNIAHVLLLHANALNADGIEDVVRLLRERGYEFESLGSVLTDEAYSSPDHYIGERGLSWLHRWSVAERGQSALEPRESPWVRALFQSYGRD